MESKLNAQNKLKTAEKFYIYLRGIQIDHAHAALAPCSVLYIPSWNLNDDLRKAHKANDSFIYTFVESKLTEQEELAKLEAFYIYLCGI